MDAELDRLAHELAEYVTFLRKVADELRQAQQRGDRAQEAALEQTYQDIMGRLARRLPAL